MQQRIESHFKEHLSTLNTMAKTMPQQIVDASVVLIEALRQGKKVLLAGNGGSAADCQHFAAELVGRFGKNRGALPAIALTTDTSILTAIGNDFGFEEIFRRQVEALGQEGDVVIGFSTSGRSANILRALEEGKRQGCRTLALLGGDGGEIAAQAEVALIVPSQRTPAIQEGHLTLVHLLCDLVEESLFPSGT